MAGDTAIQRRIGEMLRMLEELKSGSFFTQSYLRSLRVEVRVEEGDHTHQVDGRHGEAAKEKDCCGGNCGGEEKEGQSCCQGDGCDCDSGSGAPASSLTPTTGAPAEAAVISAASGVHGEPDTGLLLEELRIKTVQLAKELGMDLTLAA